MKLEWSCTVKDHNSTVFPSFKDFSISFLVMPTKASANLLLCGIVWAAGDMVHLIETQGSYGTPWNCNKVHCQILAQMVFPSSVKTSPSSLITVCVELLGSLLMIRYLEK